MYTWRECVAAAVSTQEFLVILSHPTYVPVPALHDGVPQFPLTVSQRSTTVRKLTITEQHTPPVYQVSIYVHNRHARCWLLVPLVCRVLWLLLL